MHSLSDSLSLPPLPQVEELNSLHAQQVASGEIDEKKKALCFSYLNKGSCEHGDACQFRHVAQDHPDAIADRMRRGEYHKIPASANPMIDQNPNVGYGETRICFRYLNHGKCDKDACTFRHLLPGHPDAIADRIKSGKVPDAHIMQMAQQQQQVMAQQQQQATTQMQQATQIQQYAAQVQQYAAAQQQAAYGMQQQQQPPQRPSCSASCSNQAAGQQQQQQQAAATAAAQRQYASAMQAAYGHAGASGCYGQQPAAAAAANNNGSGSTSSSQWPAMPGAEAAMAAWMAAQQQQQAAAAAMWGQYGAAAAGGMGGAAPNPWASSCNPLPGAPPPPAGLPPPAHIQQQQVASDARICFPFLNKGFCQRGAACKFRHLDQSHPDAIADRLRTGHTHRIPVGMSATQPGATAATPPGGQMAPFRYP